MAKPLVVGRERELARLSAGLRESLDGRGQVVFVSGEAGSGKTSLTEEFRRRAAEADPDLLIAEGRSTATGGAGDPYLPWREVLAVLVGMVEDAGTAAPGAGGERRGRWLARSVDLLLDVGPDLLGAIIPGAGLVAAVAVALAPQERLVKELDQQQQRESALAGHATSIQPGRIVEQYTNVLLGLARERPVLILLDDLHWVDESSAGLLFHLAQRITGSRVMIVGSYRAAEVSAPGTAGRHPMEKVLSEIKRYSGDVTIDLDRAADDERAAFLDLLLDSEPNRFGPDFRRDLFRLTGAHALFTVELLRSLMERGDVVRDPSGAWCEAPGLDWDAMPARVEGVIEERIARLSEQEREILDVGCVEGTTFTAGVVAGVLERPLRSLLKDLSVSLERQHRVVREDVDPAPKGGGPGLSAYRFSHALLQKYLYDDLGSGTRALTHADVARALEQLHGDRAGELSARLAWHYEAAGEAGRAAPYLVAAATAAASRGAPAEARDLFLRALEVLTDVGDDVWWRARTGLDTVLALLGQRELRGRSIDVTVEEMRRLGNVVRLAEALWMRTRFVGEIRDARAERDAATVALEAARAAARPDLVAMNLSSLAWSRAALLDVEGARSASVEAWEQAQASADEGTLAFVAMGMALFHHDNGDLGRAVEFELEATAHARRLGDRDLLGRSLGNMSYTYLMLGRPDRALEPAQEAVVLGRSIGDVRVLPYTLGNIGLIQLALGHDEDAVEVLTEALSLVEGGEDVFLIAATTGYLGLAAEAGGRTAEAAGRFTRSRDLFLNATDGNAPHYAADSEAGLARCALALGDPAAAVSHALVVWNQLSDPTSRMPEFEARDLLTCAQVFAAAGDVTRAAAATHAGARSVLAQAGTISDATWRTAYLADPVHRDLLARAAALSAETG